MATKTCVNGDTPVLTENGWHSIRSLLGNVVRVWNGCDWADALVLRTCDAQKLYKVKMSDGSYVKCTKDHTFIVKDASGKYVERKTDELISGDECKEVQLFPATLSSVSPTDPRFQYEKMKDNEVPFEFRIFSRLLWLSKRFDEDAGYLQITHNDKNWLRQIKLLANGLGTAPYIGKTVRGYHLRFSSEDVRILIDDLLMPMNRSVKYYRFNKRPPLTIVSVNELNGLYDTYYFNAPQCTHGVFNGVFSGSQL